MYSYRETSTGGQFASAITGKTYRFERSDFSGKRRALAELQADHARIESDLTARLGRKPTARELMRGVAPADSRPLRQRIREDATGITSAPHTGNPYTARLVELEAQIARTPAEIAQRQRRIQLAEQSSQAWEAAQARKEAARKQADAISSDVLDAQTNCNLARFGVGFNADDVRITAKLLADLQASGEVKTYRDNRDEWEASVRERREVAAKQLEAEASAQREAAKLIRRGEAAPE